jgi:glycosyltransferase involved in cell wall biosynthesis
VAVSADIKASLLREHGFSDATVAVIHNGIASAPGSPLSAAGDTFRIGSAGRLVPVKDYRLMVEMAHLLKERGCEIRFELAGDGPMRQEIEQLVRDRGLAEQFSILGFVEDTESFYRRLDVYVNTSLHEGIPMSVLEAMSRGIPVVVPDVGGLKEIVTDGVGGFVVGDRSAEGFARKCHALYKDAGLREAMSRAARRAVAERFSLDRMVASYAELYRKVERR